MHIVILAFCVVASGSLVGGTQPPFSPLLPDREKKMIKKECRNSGKQVKCYNTSCEKSCRYHNRPYGGEDYMSGMKKCGEDCRLYLAFEWQSYGVYLEKQSLNPEVLIKNFTYENTTVIGGNLLLINRHDICKHACLRRTDCLSYIITKSDDEHRTCALLNETKVAGVIQLSNKQRHAHNPSDYYMPVMYEKIATLAESVKSYCTRETREPKDIACINRTRGNDGRWVERRVKCPHERPYNRCLVQECDERCGGKFDGHKNVNVPCRISCKKHAGLWAKYRKSY